MYNQRHFLLDRLLVLRGSRELAGHAVNQSLQYVPTEDDEVEDLFLLLQEVKVHEDCSTKACSKVAQIRSIMGRLVAEVSVSVSAYDAIVVL